MLLDTDATRFAHDYFYQLNSLPGFTPRALAGAMMPPSKSHNKTF